MNRDSVHNDPLDVAKKHHLNTVEQAGTAKGLWETFQPTYKAKSNANRIALRKQLNTLKKLPSEPITKYVDRAKTHLERPYSNRHRDAGDRGHPSHFDRLQC